MFDFDVRMCALARLFFPDENVVRQFGIRAESVGVLVAGVESAVPDPDRQWLHINAGLPCSDGSKANPRRDPSKLLGHVATFFFVVRRLQERFAKVTWFAENVVCETFVATMKALFLDSVHEVIESGRLTAEQRKRAHFASPEFDLTKLTELDGGCTVEEWFKLDAKNGPYEMRSGSSGTVNRAKITQLLSRIVIFTGTFSGVLTTETNGHGGASPSSRRAAPTAAAAAATTGGAAPARPCVTPANAGGLLDSFEVANGGGGGGGNDPDAGGDAVADGRQGGGRRRRERRRSRKRSD